MSLSFTLRRGLLNSVWTPAVEQLRFRNRPNLKRPLPLHYNRARMLRLCEPQYPEEVKVCKKVAEDTALVKPIEENPYAVYLAKKMKKQFETHPMIAIFHWNTYSQHELLRIRGLLFDANFDMTILPEVNAKVAGLALRNSKFEPVLRLVMPPTAFGFCKNTDAKKLLQLNRKMHAFVLLGAVVDNRLLHKADFEGYASKDLDTVRALLSQTLSSAGGKNLSSTLESSSLTLSNNLASYINSKKDTPSESAGKDPAE